MRRRSDKFSAACAVLCILSALVSAGVVGPSVLDTSKRTEETAKLAADNAQLGRENIKRIREVAQLARAIQDQRKDSIRSNCRALNRRHHNTIRALDVLIAKLPPGPRRARAKAGKRSTVFLLNQIVPHQNCRKLVAKTAPTP